MCLIEDCCHIFLTWLREGEKKVGLELKNEVSSHFGGVVGG